MSSGVPFNDVLILVGLGGGVMSGLVGLVWADLGRRLTALESNVTGGAVTGHTALHAQIESRLDDHDRRLVHLAGSLDRATAPAWGTPMRRKTDWPSDANRDA